MRSRLLPAIVPVLATLAPAAAGPLPPERLPSDAAWVMHADLELAVSTRLGAFVVSSMWEELESTPIGELEIEAGADLRDLTLFGWADEEAGAVVMGTMADGGAVDRLLAHVRERAGYERLEHEGQAIHSWLEATHAGACQVEGGAGAGADAENRGEVEVGVRIRADESGRVRVYALDRALGEGQGRRLIAASDSMDALLNLSRVMNEKAPSRADAAESRLPVAVPAGSFFFVAATDPRPFGQEPAAQVAKLAEVVAFSAGEEAGEGFVNLSVSARTAQEASQIAQVLQGMAALGLMMIPPDDPDAGWLRQLAACVSFQADGLQVSASCRFDPQIVIDGHAKNQDEGQEEEEPAPADGPGG